MNAKLFFAAVTATVGLGAAVFGQTENPAGLVPPPPAQPVQAAPGSAAYDPLALAPLLAVCETDAGARQKLVAIRDRDARAFSSGQGSFKIFQELYDINRALGDDEATIALFRLIVPSDPALARSCEFVIGPLLARRHEYDLSLQNIGNPETRFNLYRATFQRMAARAENSAARMDALHQQQKTADLQAGRPPMQFPWLNPGKLELKLARERFVRDVCELVEVLVGTGHREEAERIRGEAVAVLDDPRLQSAVSHAEEHLKNPDAVPSAGDMEAAVVSAAPAPAPVPMPAPAMVPAPPPGILPSPAINPATGLPTGSATPPTAINPLTGMPAGLPNADAGMDKGHDWPFMKMNSLYLSGKYAEVLPALQKLYHTKTGATPRREIVTLWTKVAGKYPPARLALLDVRDEQADILSRGGGDGQRFFEVRLMNEALNQASNTVALFRTLDSRHPGLAARCYGYAEPGLMAAGDYALCLEYYTGRLYLKPEDCLNSLTTNLDFMRKILPLWRENQRKSREQLALSLDKIQTIKEAGERQIEAQLAQQKSDGERFRQELWDQERTNVPNAELWEWPASPPPLFVPPPLPHPPAPPPTFTLPAAIDQGLPVTNSFVIHIHNLVEILVATGRHDEAEKIRDAAVAELDDPRLRAAVTDAEARVQERQTAAN